MEFRSIKGTYDILPNDANRWQRVETRVREFIIRAGYSEIRTPAFERTELFTRSVGEAVSYTHLTLPTILLV